MTTSSMEDENMYFKNLINKHKILVMLTISYLTIITIFLISYFAIYATAKNLLRDYSDYNSQLMVDNIAEKFDEFFIYGNTKIVNKILLNKNIEKSVTNIKNGDSSKLELINIKNELSLLAVDNKYVEDILIYIKDNDIIIRASGFSTVRQYYITYACDNFSSIDEFTDFLNTAETPKYLYSSKVDQMLSITDYSFYESNTGVGKIILINRCKKFFQPYVGENSNVVVIQKDSILACSDMGIAEMLLNANNIDKEIIDLNQKRVYSSVFGSGHRRFYYVLDTDKIYSVEKKYGIFATIVSIICLMICIGMCIVFSLYHYKPINKLGDFIKRNIEKDGINYSYKVFLNAVDTMEKKLNWQNSRYEEKEKKIKEYYMLQWLLYKKIPEGAQNSIKLLPDQMCALVIIKAVEFDQIFFDYVYEEKTVKLKIANFILENIFDEELHNAYPDVIKCKMSNMLVFVLIFDSQLDWIKVLYSCFDRILPLVKKEFNISFNHFKSMAHYDLSDMVNTFDDLMVEIDNGDIDYNSDINGIIGLADTKEKEEAYYFPETVKKHLCDSVEAGNLKNTNEIMNNILQYNISNTEYGINNIKALAAEIYYILISRLNQFDIKAEKIFEQNMLGKDIIMCDNIEEIENSLKKFVDAICNLFLVAYNANENIYAQARRLIYQNYKNQQLSSTMIADMLGLSKDYFLSTFKQESGMKFSDCVHQIRIEHACKILQRTSCSIAEISNLVGYSNAKTFTRAFVNIVGITPGAYREKNFI